MEPQIITKEGFKALGFKWQGTFEEASEGGIHKLFPQLREVAGGIDNKVEPGIVKGLSYHNLNNGLTYYLCHEVSEIEEIEYGLEIIEVPSYTYAVLSMKDRGLCNPIRHCIPGLRNRNILWTSKSSNTLKSIRLIIILIQTS